MLLLDRFFEMSCKQERVKLRYKLFPYSEPPELPPVICVKVSLFVPRLKLKPNLRGSGNGNPLQNHLWETLMDGEGQDSVTASKR